MKWFKHFTNASTGETLSELFDEFGFEGLGMFWVLVETVGSHWDGKSIPCMRRSRKVWRKLTGIYPQTFEKLLRFLEDISDLSATFDEKGIEVCIPKLLEIKDEYTRKSGHSPDNVAPEVEIEVEVENIKNKNTPPAGSEREIELGRDKTPIVFKLPLSDGTYANITEKTIQEWEKNYRFIDVRGRLANLIDWYEHNPDGQSRRMNRKEWFFGIANIIRKASDQQKAQMALEDPSFDPNDPTGDIKAEEDRKRRLKEKIDRLKQQTSLPLENEEEEY